MIFVASLGVIASIIIYFLICYYYRDASEVELVNVSPDIAAKALWEEGGQRKDYSLFGSKVQVWPSVEAVNNPKTVITYEIAQIIGSMHGRDTIGITKKEPNATVISLKCEEKQWFFHKRNRDRERRVLQKTVWRLMRNAGNVSVRGVNGWQPAGLPIVVVKNSAKWIAIRNGSIEEVEQYLQANGYRKLDISSSSRMVFSRQLNADPDGGLNIFSTKWESREKVLLKVVEQTRANGSKQSVLVVGILAGGNEKSRLLFVHNSSVGDSLAGRLIMGISLEQAVKSKHLEFTDPSTWIEKIKLEPWQAAPKEEP
ncbi:MAG: hypothetical protein K8S55_09310 [Phycisphaerae bacterium]|nr:hypothetical protein [Phycisphaerae bacterium]